MTLSLFDCPDTMPLPWNAPTTITTPLGTLGFEAMIDGVDVCGLVPSAASRLPSGGRLFRWLIDQFQAELLLTPLTPRLSEGMRLDGCWAGVWRARAAVDIEGVEFRSEWESGHSWRSRGPDSGQWLDAQTWDDARVQVTVGTEDALALASRAARGEWLPMRWAERLGYTDLSAGGAERIDPVVYTPQGLRLSLTDLQRGEGCQVHFVAAWCPAPPTPEEARTVPLYWSAWYAVDQTPAAVLSGAGCR